MEKKHIAEIAAGIIAAAVVIHFAVNPTDVELMKALQKRISEIFIKKETIIKEREKKDELGNGAPEPRDIDSSADG